MLTAAFPALRWGAVLRLPSSPPLPARHTPVPARALEPSPGQQGARTRPCAPPAPQGAQCRLGVARSGLCMPPLCFDGRPPSANKSPIHAPRALQSPRQGRGRGRRPRGDERNPRAGRAGSLGKSRAGPQHVAAAPTADSARAGGALRAPTQPTLRQRRRDPNRVEPP